MNLVSLSLYFKIIEFSVSEEKIKDLERQLRKKDVHNRLQNLEDEAYMRDVIMAETYSTLRDSKQHNRGRSLSDL